MNLLERGARALIAVSLCAGTASATPPRSAGRTANDRIATIDLAQKIDINNVAMFVTNVGTIAWDIPTGTAGLEVPKGSGKTAVFASGVWLGAKVNGGIRLALAEYSQEHLPGALLPGGMPDDPNKAEYKVYKLNRTYADSNERDAALADYTAGAVPHGAPPVTVQLDGSLDILGDQMVWAVYNDAAPLPHNNPAGQTAPLGVEVQQTTFAFSLKGTLDNTVFVQYKVINKGSNMLDSMFVSQWADPDLGDFTDDLVGCDTTLGVGFAYNATNNDNVYGPTPPCVGFDLLRGPKNAMGDRLGLTAFTKYINGADPDTSTESYNYLTGLNADGTPIINPVTGDPTYFMVSGDPVAGTGWLDTSPSDRRMQLSSGPFHMAPGDTQQFAIGIVIGQGSDRLSSISAMRMLDVLAQETFDDVKPLPTDVLVSFVASEVEDRRVRLTWAAPRGALQTAEVYRSQEGTPWTSLGKVTPDAWGVIVFEDAAVSPGGRYSYRLGIRDDSGEKFYGETIVEVPRVAFSLQGFRPGPAPGDLAVAFSLPSAAPARIEVLDLGGRRVIDRRLVGAEPGPHVLALGPGAALPPGVYLIRLTQEGRWRVAKGVVVR